MLKIFDKIHKSTRKLRSISINNYTLKYFKNVYKIKEAELRFTSENKLAVHPFSNFGLGNEIFMLFVIILYAFIMPYYWTFCPDNFTEFVLNIFFDILFMVNLILCFFTGYVDSYNNIVVTDFKMIAKNYIKTWFLIDLIGILPINFLLISMDTYQGLSIIKSLRILKIIRILRLIKYKTYIHEMDKFIKNQISFYHLGMWITIVLHLFACLQFLVPELNGTLEKYFIGFYPLINGSCFEKYTWSLHYTTSQILSTGYGISLQFPSNTEGWLVCLTMLGGHMVLGVLASAMVVYFSFNDNIDNFCYDRIEKVRLFIKKYQLSPEIARKILDHFANNINRLYTNEKNILIESDLPKSIQTSLQRIRLLEAMKSSIMLFQCPIELLKELSEYSQRICIFNSSQLINQSVFINFELIFILYGYVTVSNQLELIKYCYGSLDFINVKQVNQRSAYSMEIDKLFIKFHGGCELFCWKMEQLDQIKTRYTNLYYLIENLKFR